jgi:hypothetical protein
MTAVKKLTTIICAFLLLQAAAQKTDSIQYTKPIYFTVLGVGTEHAQVALIGNIAPAPFDGVQVATVFNIASRNMNGLQMAGVYNHAGDSMNGIQLSGCINTAYGNMRGIQAAGAINMVGGNVYGAQLSGGINMARGDVRHLQIAGSGNYARHIYGLQASGGINIASGTVYGLQLSGGVNVAKNVKGFQVGVINFADSVTGGMIGVLSFARHGYHKVEMGWNETMPINLSVRTGSALFHNILSFSVDHRPRQIVWGFGYGIGTAWRIHSRIDLNVDMIGYHINRGEFSESVNNLGKLNLTADFHLAKNFSIAAGPSLNTFVTDLHPGHNDAPITGFAPYYFFTQTYDNRWNVKSWVGANITIRFF